MRHSLPQKLHCPQDNFTCGANFTRRKAHLVEKPTSRNLSVFLVRTTGFEPAASSASPPVCGARYLLCRRSGCVSHRPLHQNACPSSATGSGQAFCPKQVPCFACKLPQTNLGSEKHKENHPQGGSSLCVVRTTGFEPAASCSQSKRSTKLSHVRII